MKRPFKMKGSPMKRNFGISPMKHTTSDNRGDKNTQHNRKHSLNPNWGSDHSGEAGKDPRYHDDSGKYLLGKSAPEKNE
mgnify:CR=1 FL=1